MNKIILVVDDEPDILEMIRYHLEKNGYDVRTAGDGESALKLCQQEPPDLMILDIMLPGIDGHHVCYRLKSNDALRHVPVIMLTAKSEETDEVVGLKIGADDYITKPFSPRILLARVEAILRREAASERAASDDVIRRDLLEIYPKRHEVLVDKKPVRLTPAEFNILVYLAGRPGLVFSRQQIIETARGQDVIITERTVDVHIATLRKKLGRSAALIETVHGIGYKFRGSS